MYNSHQSHWVAEFFAIVSFELQLSRFDHFNVTVFSDDDWGAEPDDCRSTSGHCVFLGSNLIL